MPTFQVLVKSLQLTFHCMLDEGSDTYEQKFSGKVNNLVQFFFFQ